MGENHIAQQNGCYRIAGTRVSLDSIVYAYRDGDALETIQQSFPVLTLEQVRQAVEYYLAHRDEVDAHLRREEAEFEERRRQSRQQNPELSERLQAARRSKLLTTR